MASVSTGTHYPGCLKDESCRCKIPRYRRALAIACIFAIIEASAGYWGESSSLMADALHLVADNASLIIAIVVASAEVRRWNAVMVRSVGTWCVIGMLVFFALGVVSYGVVRLFEPRLAMGWLVMGVAVMGLLANYAQYRELAQVPVPEGHHDDILQANILHIIGDAMISVAVIAGGMGTLVTGITWIDPVLSIGIGCWIMWSAWGMIRSRRVHAHHHHHHHHD